METLDFAEIPLDFAYPLVWRQVGWYNGYRQGDWGGVQFIWTSVDEPARTDYLIRKG